MHRKIKRFREPVVSLSPGSTCRATKSHGRHKTHDFPSLTLSTLPSCGQKHKHRAYLIVAGISVPSVRLGWASYIFKRRRVAWPGPPRPAAKRRSDVRSVGQLEKEGTEIRSTSSRCCLLRSATTPRGGFNAPKIDFPSRSADEHAFFSPSLSRVLSFSQAECLVLSRDSLSRSLFLAQARDEDSGLPGVSSARRTCPGVRRLYGSPAPVHRGHSVSLFGHPRTTHSATSGRFLTLSFPFSLLATPFASREKRLRKASPRRCTSCPVCPRRVCCRLAASLASPGRRGRGEERGRGRTGPPLQTRDTRDPRDGSLGAATVSPG